LKISRPKKRGRNRNRFFAQSFGLKSLRYATVLIIIGTKYKQTHKIYNIAAKYQDSLIYR